MVSFLDPRFKIQYIAEADLELVKDRLKDEGVALVDRSIKLLGPLQRQKYLHLCPKREILAHY